jgi:hypothetical protein
VIFVAVCRDKCRDRKNCAISSTLT